MYRVVYRAMVLMPFLAMAGCVSETGSGQSLIACDEGVFEGERCLDESRECRAADERCDCDDGRWTCASLAIAVEPSCELGEREQLEFCERHLRACNDADFDGCEAAYEHCATHCESEPNPCEGVVCEGDLVCVEGRCVEEERCGRVVCREGEICDDGVCHPFDRCADVTCREGEYCSEGECIRRDPCRGVTCLRGEICVEGSCVGPDACSEIVCPDDEYCRDGECLRRDACEDVICEDGAYCVDGECVHRSACEDIVCGPREYCREGECLPIDLCADVVCAPGEYCAEGECLRRDICDDTTCPDGHRCVDGECVGPNLCEGVVCGDGEYCSLGECLVLDHCADVVCADGEVCEEGRCIRNLCGDEVCAEGETCVDDICVAPATCSSCQVAALECRRACDRNDRAHAPMVGDYPLSECGEGVLNGQACAAGTPRCKKGEIEYCDCHEGTYECNPTYAFEVDACEPDRLSQCYDFFVDIYGFEEGREIASSVCIFSPGECEERAECFESCETVREECSSSCTAADGCEATIGASCDYVISEGLTLFEGERVVSDDGLTVVVGSPNLPSPRFDVENAGMLTILQRRSVDEPWTRRGMGSPTPTEGGAYAQSVAISPNGHLVAVTAAEDRVVEIWRTGASIGDWTRVAAVSAPEARYYRALAYHDGGFLALYRNTIHQFKEEADVWTREVHELAEVPDQTIAMGVGSNRVYVSAGSSVRDESTGIWRQNRVVYGYLITGPGDFVLRDIFAAPEPLEAGRFGDSISVTRVPGRILIAVGAPEDDRFGTEAGAVYLFDNESANASGWANLIQTIGSPSPRLEGHFGASVALDGAATRLVAMEEASAPADWTGDYAVVQAYAVGASQLEHVHTFHPEVSGSHRSTRNLNVAMSGDGSLIFMEGYATLHHR